MAAMTLTAGFDIGGTKVALAVSEDVARDCGGPLAAVCPTPQSPEALGDLVAKLVDEHCPDVEAVGVGFPGCVENGVVVHAPHLPEFIDIELQSLFASRIRGSTEIAIDNDANCAALAHARMHDERDLVTVTLGTGIGGGIVIGGSVVRGRFGVGGEIGHQITHVGGRSCECGQLGCWEQYASGSALGRLAVAAGFDSGRALFERVGAGDTAALVCRDEWVSEVATGIINLVNIFDPPLVVIGGGVSDEWDAFGEELRVLVREGGFPYRRRILPIVPAEGASRAGAWGAALSIGDRLA